MKMCHNHHVPLMEVREGNITVDVCPHGDAILFDGANELNAFLAFKFQQIGTALPPHLMVPVVPDGRTVRNPAGYFSGPPMHHGHSGHVPVRHHGGSSSGGHHHGYGHRRHGSGSGDSWLEEIFD